MWMMGTIGWLGWITMEIPVAKKSSCSTFRAFFTESGGEEEKTLSLLKKGINWV